jgi:tRNA pseudouridine38-40 synthase
MPTQRFKLTIAYRGTRYHGWQVQPASKTWKGRKPPPGHGIPTIQGELHRAIASVVRHPVHLVGSSRTDTGVHAKGQIAHFDTEQIDIPAEGLRRGINSLLPPDILVRKAEAVHDYFDAIQSTTRKRYQYGLWSAEDRDVFYHDLVWHRWQPLDIEAMAEAGSYFVGEHDFASFARPGHRRFSTIRTIYGCDISFRSPFAVIGVEGNGFLWNMVRIIVGTLVQVGIGRLPVDEIPDMLAACDRKAGGPTAPPHGLYLQWIKTKSLEEILACVSGQEEPAIDESEYPDDEIASEERPLADNI